MYKLELEKVINEIKKTGAKNILLQLPDGLKPKAKDIQKAILENTKTNILIWAGSCFGSCDVPLCSAKQLEADLIIQWGHSKWK